MRGKNKGTIMSQHQYEKEEQARIKIKKYFLMGQMNFAATIFTLHLLGFSLTRAKETVIDWTYKKQS